MTVFQSGRIKENIKLTVAAVLCIAVFVMVFLDLAGYPKGRDSWLAGAPAAGDPNADYVKIMDVGQGDAILIYSNGRSAVIDTGMPDAANDICYDLSYAGIRSLDALLLTHLHKDHVGGVDRVLERYSVKNLIRPELRSDCEGYAAVKAAEAAVARSGGKIYTAVQGMHFNVGEFEVTVLAYEHELPDENNRSVVTAAEIDGVKFLFMADAETPVESALLEEGIHVDCDVLKVGHHGSSTSTTSAFLKAVSPRYAAISVGEDNRYSHPHREVLQELNSCGAEIFRTDRDGDITFYVEDGAIRTETENGH